MHYLAMFPSLVVLQFCLERVLVLVPVSIPPHVGVPWPHWGRGIEHMKLELRVEPDGHEERMTSREDHFLQEEFLRNTYVIAYSITN